MANEQNGNTFYIVATGALTTNKGTRVSHVVFTPDAAFDQLVLKDTDNSGAIKLNIKGAVAKQTIDLQLLSPIVFPGGVYVATLTSNATATLVTTGGPS